jgi:hypothetical protein
MSLVRSHAPSSCSPFPPASQDPSFCEALATLVSLRHTLWAQSQALVTSPDSVPLDLMLGSLATELAAHLRGLVPQVRRPGSGEGAGGVVEVAEQACMQEQRWCTLI